jgi:hypothetical protein
MWRPALFAIVSACSGAPAAADGGADGSGGPLAISIEAKQASGAFVPMQDGGEAELFVGIQGLVFLELRLVATGGTAELVDSTLRFTVEGLEELSQTNVMVELLPDGPVRRSQELRLVFPGSIDPASQLVEHMMHLDGRWTRSGGGETATTAFDLIIRNDDPCIHRPPPEEPLCPSDAGPQ